MPHPGSWWQLASIMAEARQLVAEEYDRSRLACPNDGEPYRTGPDGELYCPYDGYRPRT